MQRGSTVYKNRAKKRFGQNFLIDEGIIDEIIDAADIGENDTVLEIGPGRGALTERLVQRAGRIIAVEIDWDLAALLEQNFAGCGNLEIIQGDVLKLDLSQILPKDQPVKVVANLPYYITTPIMMMLLESELAIRRIVVMVQKEVALRMCAKSGSPDYGALSLAVAYNSNPRIVVDVPARCFRPVPKVDSCVVCMDITEPPCDGNERELLFSCIKAAFAQRRKTLVNALSSGGIVDKTACADIICRLGLNENIRGEKLSLEDFIRLSSAIKEHRRISDGC